MKVCFVCQEATRLFDPTSTRRFGGAARQAAALAKGLAEHSAHEVSFVLGTVDPRRPERFGKVQAYFDETYDSRRGHFPWMRWTRPRVSLLWEIPRAGWRRMRERLGGRPWGSPLYRRLDADVVLVFGVNHVSEHVVRERQGRPGATVLRVISDENLSASYADSGQASEPDRPGDGAGRYLLATVDAVCAQTERQQRLLRDRFDREEVIVRNPVDLAPLDEPDDRAARKHVLWIGRADRDEKMPERFLALAERLPDLDFLMVMNDEQRRIWEEIVAMAPPNVHVERFVPPEEIGALYRRALAVVNTSRHEGFPNTLLEATVHRAPFLSLEVDPGGLAASHDAAYCAGGDLGALAEEVRRAAALEAPWPDRQEAAVAYVREHGSIQGSVAGLERLFARLAQSG